MRLLYVFAVVPGLLAGAARAEDLPQFDIRAYCAVRASAGSSSSCQRVEEAKRAELVQRWLSFPKQRKHFCVQSATFRRKDQRSYEGLAGCLSEATTS